MSPTNPLLDGGERIPFHTMGAEHVRPAIREILERADREIDKVAEAPVSRATRGPSNVSMTSSRAWKRGSRPLGSSCPWPRHRISGKHTTRSCPKSPRSGRDSRYIQDCGRPWSGSHGAWKLASWTPCGAESREDAPRVSEGGAELDDADKARLQEIRVELSELQQRFSENVLDATNAFELHITDCERLDGIPETALELARVKASEHDQDGWLLTLDYPSYEPVLKYALDRELRKELHVAYVRRCREGRLDNRPLIARILELRRELAALLGYPDYSDYRLDEAMAHSGARAFEFVEDLRERTQVYWKRDLANLRAHSTSLGIDEIEPWDLAFVSESLRRELFEIDDEMVRPYFPLATVLAASSKSSSVYSGLPS